MMEAGQASLKPEMEGKRSSSPLEGVKAWDSLMEAGQASKVASSEASSSRSGRGNGLLFSTGWTVSKRQSIGQS